jgi:hypothetical protein
MKQHLTFIIVALDTGTNLPAVSVSSLSAILMTKLTQRMKGTGAPTQSQPQAASLTLWACKVANQFQKLSKNLVFKILQRVNILIYDFVAVIQLAVKICYISHAFTTYFVLK